MRTFAKPRQLSLTDRICNNSHVKLRGSSWDKQTQHNRKQPQGRDKQAKQ